MSMVFRRGHLHYFVTVAEEGHITRAAQKLHITQPTLSQAIALLESDLGFPLLERQGRGIKLTPDGEAFLVKARAASSAWTQAFTPAQALEQVREEAIVLGFLGVPPGLDSPAPLEAFSRAYPDIDLRYRELSFPTPPTISWLAEVDVAVCHQPPPDPDVWTHTLRFEPRVVLAPRRHPLAERSELEVAELLDETFIGFHPSVERTWAGFWSLDDHRGAPPRHSTADHAANPQEVIASLTLRRAITTVPSSVARLVSSVFPGVVAVPLRDAQPSRITLVGHEDCRNPCVPALLAFARKGNNPAE
jgi:DNA-binding transcriptional LysR family regulator